MIAAYKGLSFWPSKLIRIMHRAEYSHVAWVDDDTEEVFEAWNGGVRRTPSIHHQHTPGTPVDLFRVEGQQHYHTTALRQFHIAQVGKPYDWKGVMRFVTRGREDEPENPSDWFCSRLLMCAHRMVGLPLLARVEDWKVFPGEVTYSPRLHLVKSVIVEDVKTMEGRALTGIRTNSDYQAA